VQWQADSTPGVLLFSFNPLCTETVKQERDVNRRE